MSLLCVIVLQSSWNMYSVLTTCHRIHTCILLPLSISDLYIYTICTSVLFRSVREIYIVCVPLWDCKASRELQQFLSSTSRNLCVCFSQTAVQQERSSEQLVLETYNYKSNKHYELTKRNKLFFSRMMFKIAAKLEYAS